jgi:hypothetical protein
VEAIVARGDGVTFCGDGEGHVGEIPIRYILLDIDNDMAERLKICDGPSDIKPRRFKESKGEFLAIGLMEEGIGTVIDCGEWQAKLGEPMPVESTRRFVYTRSKRISGGVSDSVNWTAEISVAEDGFHGKLTVHRLDGAYSLTVESESRQLEMPPREFRGGRVLAIETPALTTMQRLAVETVAQGETAMFQLSRAGGTEYGQVRLLFLRITGDGS